MKKSVWIWIMTGLLATATALIIEITQIFFQTDPVATNTVTINTTIILLIIAGFLFDTAYIDWKQEINRILVLVLVVVGLIGFSASLMFHNTLVDIFFPKTYVPTFLTINFAAVAVAGAFLPLFNQTLKKDTSDVSDVSV